MTNPDPDYHEMLAWFELQSDQVKSNAKIVDTAVRNQSFMLHIDKNTPKVFTPRMPPSADKREDTTCPRITVSPTLMGCFIGYNRGHVDFIDHAVIDKDDKDPYRGGYEICALPFKHCLVANRALVPDAYESEEHWLVTYNKDTREYVPTPAGKMFISTVAQQAVSGQDPHTLVTFYVHVTLDGGFPITPKQHVQPGFYRINAVWKNWKMRAYREADYEIEQISQELFESRKQLSAALLSHEGQPSYMRW